MNTGEKPDKILIILNRIPVYILAVFISCILFFSLLKRAEYCGYKYGDNPVWTVQNMVSLLLTSFLLLCSFLLIYWFSKKLDRFGRKRVLFTILYLSALIQVFYILYLPAKQFADQNVVNTLALNVVSGNYFHFNRGGYLFQYPNNVGITLFLSAIYRIFPDTLLVPKLLNVLFSTATSFFIFRIYEELFRPQKDKVYGILLFSGFYVPMILLNNLVYNDVYATALFAGFIYCSVSYLKTESWIYLITAAIFVIAGNFLRQVGIIFLIAVTIYFIIRKIKVLKALAFFLIVLIMLNMPLTAVNTYLLRTGRISEPIGLNSIPIHMWINIGMNERKMGYWDDSRSYNIYTHQGQWNKQISAQIYSDLIRKNIQKNGLASIAKTYVKKDIWLWTEGTYQAEYYGIGSWGYLYPTFASKLVTNNIRLRDSVRWLLHCTNLLMLGLTVGGLFHSILKREDFALILPVIILLGFIGFYTLWEIKPRYIYPIYPYLILLSYHGLRIVSERLITLVKRK